LGTKTQGLGLDGWLIIDSDEFWRMFDATAALRDWWTPEDAEAPGACYPVSTRINHAANDDEECSRPVELAQIQDRLFS